LIRNKSFLLRLSDSELKRLDRCVGKTTMSREAYVRSLVFGYEPQARPPDEYYDIISELRTIENELLKYANTIPVSSIQSVAFCTMLTNRLTTSCDRLQSMFLPHAKE